MRPAGAGVVGEIALYPEYMQPQGTYLLGLKVVPERLDRTDTFPFNLKFLPTLDLKLKTAVTFFVGENGSGKSTLLRPLLRCADYRFRVGEETNCRRVTHLRTIAHLPKSFESRFAISLAMAFSCGQSLLLILLLCSMSVKLIPSSWGIPIHGTEDTPSTRNLMEKPFWQFFKIEFAMASFSSTSRNQHSPLNVSLHFYF